MAKDNTPKVLDCTTSTAEERLADLRERVRSRLARRVTTKMTGRAPRYDEVYFEGVAWLDSLAFTDGWEDEWASTPMQEPTP